MDELASRTRERLLKHKLEAIEFITNQLSVVHKSENEKMMRYMQTGKEEDKPETFITGSTSYKTLIEILQKITGEERVTKQEIKTQSSVNVNVQSTENVKITDNMQSQILAALAGKGSKEADDE
jgi:predicted transglutaminase-like cysteine proteinase